MTKKEELLNIIRQDKNFFWVDNSLTLADLRGIASEIIENKVDKEVAKLNADPWGFNQKGWLNKKGSRKKAK